MRSAVIFTVAWFILSLVQAASVRLTSDEGYYWFFSNHLQWGYYDHPPVVALMIKIGYSIFKNELGVRLLNILVMSASLMLFFYLLPDRFRNQKIVFILLLSQPLLHYFSIIVFPDSALLFFSLLFIHGYKRWLGKADIKCSLLMGLSLAGMLYSKYHGILLLIFTLHSNWKLLRSKWFWIAIGTASILALPHLWWQIRNGFPSLQFHLLKRTNHDYLNIRFVGEYVSQQLVALGLLLAAVIAPIKNVFERTLKFIVIGVIVFFLFVSLRSFVHFHWTSIAIFPSIYLSVVCFEDKKMKKVLFFLAVPFIIFILVFRIHIVHPFIPLPAKDAGYYKNRDKWALQISELAGNRPVVFIQSFREAGLYSFYTGKPAAAVFNYQERKTQYDLWGFEDSLQGKSVLIIDKRKDSSSKEMMSKVGKKILYHYQPYFHSYFNIEIAIKKAEIKNDSIFFSASIVNSRQSDLVFYPDSLYGSPQLFYMITNKAGNNNFTGILKVLDSTDTIRKDTAREYLYSIPWQRSDEGYYIEMGFMTGGLPFSINTKSRFPIRKK